MQYKMLALAALVLAPALVLAGPNPGDPAPDFYIPDTAGNYHYLSSYQGSVIQLFFWYSG